MAIAPLLLVCSAGAFAQTWSATPSSADWGTAANWSPATVPDNSSAIVEFGTSTVTDLSITGESFSLDTLRLNAGADAYSFDIDGTNFGISLNGAGVDNLSASPATFQLSNEGQLVLTGAATTLADSVIDNDSDSRILFFAGTAGTADITTGNGARTQFYYDASAESSQLVTNSGGLTEFLGSSSGGSATITTNSGGRTIFYQTSTAGSASLIVNSGGRLEFTWSSTAPDAQITNGSGGQVFISGLNASGTAIGSIDGLGNVLLGSKNLELGSPNTDMSIGGVISGSGGSLTKVGSGILTLTGANTYSGGTTISGGGISIVSDNNLGAAAGGLTFDGGQLRTQAGLTSARSVTLGAGGGTIDTNGSSSTLSGAITGLGSLTKTGLGVLTLTGTNTYTGGTTINAGTLVGDTDSLQGNIVANGGTLRFDQATDGTYSGAMSGASGSLMKIGEGTLTFSGTDTRSGLTTVNAGTLHVSGGTITGTGAVTLGQLASDEGTLHVSGSTSSVQTSPANNVIVGSAGTGTLLIDGGASVQNSIGVIASSAGSSGTATVTGTGSLWNNTSGFGIVGMNGAGSLTIADGAEVRATNTLYLGYSAGSSGVLNIGSGGAAGALTTNFVNGSNSATVNFDHTETAYTFAPQLTGTLSVNHNGSGTTILSGNNSFAGTTMINAGTLAISANENLGAASSTIAFGGGTLRTDAAMSSARDIALQAGGGTIDTNGFDSTFSGTLGGVGGLTKSGAGTLALTGANTYSGGTVINAGTLAISDDANLGAASGAIALADGTLRTDAALSSARGVTLQGGGGTIDTNGFDSTLSGVLSGSGGLTKSGVGTLTLTGANTYTGGTAVSAGTLQGDTSSLQGAIVNQASVVFDQASDGTYSGAMSGAGSLTKLGAGTLTITGSNTYTGGTIVSAGTLRGDTSSLQGSVVNNAAVVFDQASDGSFTGAMSGAGSLTKVGTGTLTLTGANTYTGGTSVSAGTLLGDTSSLQGAILNEASVVFEQTGDGTYNGVMSGTGSLTKLGAGTLTLAGTNTYSGGTAISAGTLAITADRNLGADDGALSFDGGTLQTSGTFAIERATTLAAGGGALDVAAESTLTLDGSIAGGGELRKLGGGTLRLRGANTYSGGTTVLAGTLEGDSTSLRGAVTNDANVLFVQETDDTFDGILSGTGTLTKSGTGNLVLTGAHTYTGPTQVERGTLSVNGTLASAVSVGSGAWLSGLGTVDNAVTVSDGATLTAGYSSVGTLTIGGPLTLEPGSRLVLEADQTGNADRIDVTGPQGTVLIEGGTLRLEAMGSADGYQRDATYTVLTGAGGVDGEFDVVTTNLAFLTPMVLYEPNAVHLSFNRNGVAYGDIAETDNQQAVAGYLDALSDDRGLNDLVRRLDGLTQEQARTTFAQLGGDGLSGLARVSLGTTARVQTMLSDRLGAADMGSFDSAAATRNEQGSLAASSGLAGGVWVRLIGSNGEADGDENITGYSWASSGAAVGAEARLGRQALVGASLIHTRTDLDFHGAGLGASDITTPRAIAYGSYTWSRPSAHRRHQRSRTQVRGMLGFAEHRYDTQRSVALGAYTSNARGTHTGQEFSALAEVEFIEEIGKYSLQMLFGARYIQLSEAPYRESDGLTNLVVDSRTTRSFAPKVGLRFVHPEFVPRGTLELRASWSRELENDPLPIRGRFIESSSDTHFTVTGAPQAADALAIGARFTSEIADGLFLYGSYDAEIHRDLGSERSAMLGVSYSW